MSTRIGLGGDCNVLHGRAHREQSIPRSSARLSEARLRRAKRGPAERSEARAVNRALRARCRRKLEAFKKEATQLPRPNGLGRRESVLSTYGMDTLNLGASRSECVSRVLKCALVRCLSTQTRFRYNQIRSRSTPVYPNAREQIWQTDI